MNQVENHETAPSRISPTGIALDFRSFASRGVPVDLPRLVLVSVWCLCLAATRLHSGKSFLNTSQDLLNGLLETSMLYFMVSSVDL